MAPSFTRPCVVACAITAANALALVKNSAMDVEVEETLKKKYKAFGYGNCSPDEKENGSRIGDWVYDYGKIHGMKACDADVTCKGVHWNVEDKGYVLVTRVGPKLGEETDKGEVCYEKPSSSWGKSEAAGDGSGEEDASLHAEEAETDEDADEEQTLSKVDVKENNEAAVEAEIIQNTTGTNDWHFQENIEAIRAAHRLLPSITIGSQNCIGSDGAQALAKFHHLKSLAMGEDNGISSKVLGALTKLTSLNLGGTNSYDSGIYMALAKMTELTSLTIGSKNVFGQDSMCTAGFKESEPEEEEQELFAKPRDLIKGTQNHKFAMAKALAHCKELFVGEKNCIGVEGANALGQLKRLKSLNIGSKNFIGVDGAVALGGLLKLTELSIGNGNGFGKPGFRALAALTKLTSLTIGDKNLFGVDHYAQKDELQEAQHDQCQKARESGED